MEVAFQKVAIVGLGLIGGSFAKALRAYTNCEVVGFDRDEETCRQAKEQGVIADYNSDITLKSCDLVVLGLYPHAAVEFVRTQLHLLKPGCVIMDLCGVKRFVCEQMTRLTQGRSITFVGGHPMAGREVSGYANSDKDLFCEASMILTPQADAPQAVVDPLKALLLSLGFGKIVVTDAHDHDQMIAFTSQLAHIVSSSYIKSPCAVRHRGYSAGSFADLTRVAKLNEDMWTELFLLNADNLSQEIGTVIAHLQEYQDALDQNDYERLHILLAQGRKIKEGL